MAPFDFLLSIFRYFDTSICRYIASPEMPPGTQASGLRYVAERVSCLRVLRLPACGDCPLCAFDFRLLSFDFLLSTEDTFSLLSRVIPA